MLRFEARSGESALIERYSRAPMRILTPRPENGVPEAVLANLAGGIAGGDRCLISVKAGPGAEAVVSGQAAERIYRAIDVPAEWTTQLTLASGTVLEWLPQETILFDGARLNRCMNVRMKGDARLLAVETLVFGRAAHGERVAGGGLADRWRIDRDGRPVWRDALCLRDRAFGQAATTTASLGGSRVLATLIYAAPDAPERMELLRRLLGHMSTFAGASHVRGLAVVRFLAREAGIFKRELADFIGTFRASVLDRLALPPRVWLC